MKPRQLVLQGQQLPCLRLQTKKEKREKNTRAVSCHSLRAQKIKKNQRVLTAEQKVPEAQERHRNARSQSERGRKKSCA